MITLRYLKKRLGWQDIRESHWPGDPDRGIAPLVYFRVHPSQPAWPDVYFVFEGAQDYACLLQLGFSDWHAHFDRDRSEPRNVVRAVRFASSLIRRELAIAEFLAADGRWLGGCAVPGNGLPTSVPADAATIRRIFFDTQPVVEPIDLASYSVVKYGERFLHGVWPPL